MKNPLLERGMGCALADLTCFIFDFSSAQCRYFEHDRGTVGPAKCLCRMTEQLSILIENSLQIAWDFLEGVGEIDDPQQTAEFLLGNIKSQMLRGEGRPLVLSNRAIDSFRRDHSAEAVRRSG
jgi:hypothetical protein